MAYSQVLWLHKKWSFFDSTWNLAVMGGSHPCDGTKAITEQGCNFISLWHSMGFPSLLLLQIGDSDTKNSEDSYETISKVSTCYISAIFLPRVAKVVSVLSSCYSGCSDWPLVKPPLILAYINILGVNITADKWQCPCSFLLSSGTNLWQRSQCVSRAVTS